MLRPRQRRTLLLALPGSLLLGHALTSSLAGPASGGAMSGASIVRPLVCVALPLIGFSAASTTVEGFRGKGRPLRLAPMVFQQVIAFLAVDSIEHLAGGSMPLAGVRSGGFWAAMTLHGAVAVAVWAGLRISHGLGRVLGARVAPRRGASCSPAERMVMRTNVVPRVVPLSSLSRRGPPAAVTLRLL